MPRKYNPDALRRNREYVRAQARASGKLARLTPEGREKNRRNVEEYRIRTALGLTLTQYRAL
jgi:hypothetical protein